MERGGQLALLTRVLMPAALALTAFPAAAGVRITQAEALGSVFPGAKIERRVAYLTRAQSAEVRRRARARLESLIVPYYVGLSSEGVRGYAYFDTHVVRTMPESLMVALDPGGEVRAVEVLAFHEPEDYLPRPLWLRSFEGLTAEDEPWVKRNVPNVTGATLTAHAATEAVRRILALHSVLHPRP